MVYICYIYIYIYIWYVYIYTIYICIHIATKKTFLKINSVILRFTNLVKIRNITKLKLVLRI